jgi:hypothetical protein
MPSTNVDNSVKVLFYDLETAPNLAYVWGHYEQNVIAHDREWYILCVSYRWEHEKKTKVCAMTDYPAAYKKDPENDYHVVKELWELLNEADIVVAHNGDKFDMRKANARFIKHGLGPIAVPKSVDTLKVARRYFMFNSNKLGDLGKHLDLGVKEETGGFKTWAGCMRGDEKAWRTMIKYARQDVDLLMKVYYKIRPWMPNHPNRNVYTGSGDCPTCGAGKLRRKGTRSSQVTTWQRWVCMSCGAWSRSRMAEPVERPTIVP